MRRCLSFHRLPHGHVAQLPNMPCIPYLRNILKNRRSFKIIVSLIAWLTINQWLTVLPAGMGSGNPVYIAGCATAPINKALMEQGIRTL
jgi:hypothetical protein